MATLSEYRLTNTGEEVQKAIDDSLTTLPVKINLKVNSADVLTKTNITPYTPTDSYHPATKAYVDSVRPTISIGSTTTGAEETDASVTNSGTERDPIFNFVIPRGRTGEAAGFGDLTASINTLEPGSQATLSVSASGPSTAKEFNFNFGIPRGDKGETGDSGISAGVGTPTVKTRTLSPGSSATAQVTATGDDTAKIFNFDFGIPQGAKGETGNSGVYIGSSEPLDINQNVWVYPQGDASNILKIRQENSWYSISSIKGDQGTAAGFGIPTAQVTTLNPGDNATVSVSASGPSTAKVFNFSFGIPKGEKGNIGDLGPQGERGYYIDRVERTSGTGASGTFDTYTMFLNDISGTAAGTFNVYNGKDGAGAGTVTSVAMTSTDNSLNISGSPITSSGSLSVSHKNTITAKTSQALYPITFDKNGHINGAGTALYFTIE